MSDLNVNMEKEIFNDHTNYIKSWIKRLEDDPNIFFQACSEAEKISNFLYLNYLSQKEKDEKNGMLSKLSA